MDVSVKDAFITGDGSEWRVGTDAVDISYSFIDGLLYISEFRNKLTDSDTAYVSEKSMIPVFDLPACRDKWQLISAEYDQVTFHGRPAAGLDITLNSGNLYAYFHAIAFPGSSVIRQWIEIENKGIDTISASAVPFSMGLEFDGSWTQYRMVGGTSNPEQGLLKSTAVEFPYHEKFEAHATSAHIPWTAFQRNSGSKDGWFLQLEYLVNWSIATDAEKCSEFSLRVGIPDLDNVELTPGKKIQLPPVTLCVFANSMDDMVVRSYDWQYQYMWDYTNMDYYAKPKWAVGWFFCAQNLQEQFGERLACLDMDADIMRDMGFDMMWDDAGWSVYPTFPEDSYGNVFTSGYESHDFSPTLRYLKKMEMRWLAWFVGRPSSGVMDTKVGSWGDFEWRTDGVPFPDWESDQDLRDKITYFLDNHPGCSFHTCSGGSYYSHTFEIQRFANTNYFADNGRGDITNHYLSYIEPPDKWVDIIEPFTARCEYRSATARQIMTMVPFWGFKISEEDQENLRKDLEIYNYLLKEGVAGRWSYMFHPVIKGDIDYYYDQRSSRDRTKACIITKHKAPEKTFIYPVELIPEHEYSVCFAVSKDETTRTGQDLMDNGIVFDDVPVGEIIYLGLPGRPGNNSDTTPPLAPGNVLVRRETNIGYSGYGIYWSAGFDENWISYYEVRRNSEIIGKASKGTYYFDRWAFSTPDAAYSVRAVDGGGNTSEWTHAKLITGEPVEACALGGLFAEQGYEGWYAETSSDGKDYKSMEFIKPEKTAAADLGGSPNQRGGVEGCWEGPDGESLGRAWQKASTEAQCVRRWDAPKSGTVRITSRVFKEYYRQSKGQPIGVRILQNNNQIWPESGWATVPLNDLVGLTHDVTVDVNKGDSIRFILDKGTEPENDIIGWMPRIVYCQEVTEKDRGSIIRIACGADGPYTDSSGNAWSEDRYYCGGEAVSYTAEITEAMPAAGDMVLYQNAREGNNFSYSIPVLPGLYSIRLKFTEPQYEWIYQRPFNVSVNGREMLADFDICQDARGFRKAHERVFRYIVPDANNRIVIGLNSGYDPVMESDRAIIQAIEILPELKPVKRINCGSCENFVDWNGFIWDADTEWCESHILTSESPVAQASPTPYDQALYQTAAASNHLDYVLQMPSGLYSLHLKFAELWLDEAGKRPMDIFVNGFAVRRDWDPAAAAGQMSMSADIRVENITPDADGLIKISIEATGENDAILQGIEVE